MKTAMNVFMLCILLLCTGGEAAAQIALKPEDTAAPAPAQAQEITAAALQEKIDAISKRIDAAETDRSRGDGVTDPELSELQDRLLRLKLVKNTYSLTSERPGQEGNAGPRAGGAEAGGKRSFGPAAS